MATTDSVRLFQYSFVQRAEENTAVSRPHTPYRNSLFPMTLSAVPIVHVCSPPYYAQHQETNVAHTTSSFTWSNQRHYRGVLGPPTLNL